MDQGKETAAFLATLQKKLPGPPALAIILGSGWDPLCQLITPEIQISYSDIPGFRLTDMPGHVGELCIGTSAQNIRIALFRGRFHLYQGLSPQQIIQPVLLSHFLGVAKILLCNAAGALRADLVPGDVMLLADQINLTQAVFQPDDSLQQFVNMSEPFSPRLNRILLEKAQHLSLEIRTGIYAGVRGPQFETPAEARMLRLLGADAVGMSTVLETIAAHYFRMEACALSIITNQAGGADMPDHNKICALANDVAIRLLPLLNQFSYQISSEHNQ